VNTVACGREGRETRKKEEKDGVMRARRESVVERAVGLWRGKG
jgi:hypothetical protein